ncbi:MAG TPA: iron-containing alcohol dehydrogenase [Aggregatilineales bacterium]|nr:iron-containing alcohol dehydrogenase [Anaerolineales bacterium]HRE47573.1 iron-containing alcohol dehydrogenase [Aggregatilineales bacterium]
MTTLSFEFATATRIVFGAGKLAEIGSLAKGFGRRALVITGGTPARAEGLLGRLHAAGVLSIPFSVVGEPTIALAAAGAAAARESACDLVIGFGGGSALDAGKAIAAFVTNSAPPLRYLEVIGEGKALEQPPLPYIAIPTTAGTGAEVTRNAVLTSPEHKVKVSLRSPLMLPRLALVDPELSYGLPPAITASTGLDALTQVVEPFVCNAPNPITDALCREGIQRGAASLREAYAKDTPRAREGMALCSVLGGLALANARLGAVHGFAAPIGGMFSAPHGAICAALLPQVMAINIAALRSRAAENPALHRYEDVARLLTGNAAAAAEDGAAWVADLVSALAVSPLASYGIGVDDLPAIVAKARDASSMRGNPLPLTDEELTEVLVRAL